MIERILLRVTSLVALFTKLAHSWILKKQFKKYNTVFI